MERSKHSAVTSKSYNPQAKPRVGYLISLLGFALLFANILWVLFSPLLLAPQPHAGGASAYGVGGYVLLILQGLVVFLLPAWLVEQYYRRRSYEWVYRLRWSDTTRAHRWWPLVLYVLVVPVAEASGWVMQQVPIPGSLGFLQALEAEATAAYEAMLGERSPLGVVLVFLGVAVAAPLGEEVLFRGAVLGWGLTRCRSPHVVVWSIAVVFSLLHLQWSGFLARLLLGAILGYLALYGGLWSAILFHFINNATSHILSLTTGAESLFPTDTTPQVVLLLVLGAVAGWAIAAILRRMKSDGVSCGGYGQGRWLNLSDDDEYED